MQTGKSVSSLSSIMSVRESERERERGRERERERERPQNPRGFTIGGVYLWAHQFEHYFYARMPCTYKTGSSPLYIACQKGNYKSADLLLQCKAEPDHANEVTKIL